VDFEVLGHGSIVQLRCLFSSGGVAGFRPAAGNFLLLAQKKVTKEKSLNTDL
jgi:hypothetical protein